MMCYAWFTLCCPRCTKYNGGLFFFPSYFISGTINFCVYIVAASLPAAELEAACQQCGSEEAC